jgi:putative NADH-flavin reductase
MDKKVKYILIGLVSLVVVLFLVVVGLALSLESSEKTKNHEIETLETKFQKLLHSNDSIDCLLKEEKTKVTLLSDSINILEKQRKHKKEQYETDITSIDNNTLGQDIDFFSRNLPKSKGNR